MGICHMLFDKELFVKRFGVREINEFHIHGSADQKESF